MKKTLAITVVAVMLLTMLTGMTFTAGATEVTPTATGHLRRHMIGSTIACTAYDCAFAVQTDTPGARDGTTEHAAFAETDRSRCEILDAGSGGKPAVIGADPNTNLLYPNTKIPAMIYEIRPGRQIIQTVVTASWKEENEHA